MRVNPTMQSWLIWILTVIATITGLYHLIPHGILLAIGVLYFGFQLGDVVYKTFRLAIPKRLIDNRRNKAVIITGCDSGFGHTLAQRLDFLGLKVYACCLDSNGVGAKELQASCSDKMQVVQMNVTDDEAILRTVKYVSETLGDYKLWALVNNAGIGSVVEFEWAPLATFQRTFDVNTLGPVRVTKAFLPLLREAGEARVAITASISGRITFPGCTAYAMSKHAVTALADGLRREMKKWNISVHTIEPTLYNTSISSEKVMGDQLQKFWDQCPETIREAYGERYFEEFSRKVMSQLSTSRTNIYEVIDCMVDAVLGEAPLPRYVPNSKVVQSRTRFLLSLPTDILDYLLSKHTPQLPPAARCYGSPLLSKGEDQKTK